MRNNNREIVGKLSKNSLAANRGRNIFLVLAIALTSLMLTTVFSLGVSYLETVRAQQIRLVGTYAHAALYRPQDGEVEKLDGLDYVQSYGTGLYVGSVEQTQQLSNTDLSLYWYDKELWEKLTVPAYTDIRGSYPQAGDEIMVPAWVLSRLGIERPEIGMSVTLPVSLDGEYAERTFRLSGWFTEYTHIRSGGEGRLFVSEELAERSGHTPEEHGMTYIRFKDGDASKYTEALERDLGISDPDKIGGLPVYFQSDSSIPALAAGAGVIVLFLMFTGYLLIYNVLYISVAKDIRFYGLLKAVGMTSGQIRGVVYGQITRLCLIGIPTGLLLSSAVSFALIPALLESFMTAGNTGTGVAVSFNPLIYVGAALFALLTALIGAVRPARRASRISPVEAVRYTGVAVRDVKKRGGAFGNPAKMAFRNVFRSRRQAMLVFLSLFFGLTTFMIVTTIVKSMDADNFVNSYIDSDIILTNERGRWITSEDRQRFTPEMMEIIESLPGLSDMRIHYSEGGVMKYSSQQFGKYLEYMYGGQDMRQMFGTDEVTDEVISQSFFTYVFSLNKNDIDRLNKELDSPIDAEAFERGEFALTDTDNPELFDTVSEFEITFSPSDKTLVIPLGGFIPPYYLGMGGGLAPGVYVSEKVLEGIFENPVIMKIELNVEENGQRNAIDVIDGLTRYNYDITRISKIETREMLKNAKFMMLVLGDGIAAILGLIGVLNFVSITSTGILARRRELAMLESLGQSKKQIKRMLTAEGAVYAALSVLLAGILGSAATYGVFRLFATQADYAVFSFPFISLAVIVIVVVAVCLIVPNLTYRSISRAAIIERLREAE